MSMETFDQPRPVKKITFLDADSLAAFKAMAGEIVGRSLEAEQVPHASDVAHYLHEEPILILGGMDDVSKLEEGLRKFSSNTEKVTADLVFDNPPELIPRMRDERAKLGRVAAEIADGLSTQRMHMEIADSLYADPDQWLRSIGR